MAIIPLPRSVLAAVQWQQDGGRRPVQRSAVTGYTRELDFGPAPRWQAEATIVPHIGGTERAQQLAGFDAACKVPGNLFRLPAADPGQHPADSNIVANPYLRTGAENWVLPAAVGRVADQFPSPIDWFFRADPGAARSIEANGGNSWPAAAGSVLFVESWVFRTDTGVTCNAALQWLNSSMGVISTSTVVLAPAAGSWAVVRGQLTAPASTAFVRIRYDVGAFASGYLAVTGLRVSLLPTQALVSGAANAGRTLALSGLGRSIRNARAGHKITVVLPGGDEQLNELAADLIADASGNGTASLVTPLRKTPAASAAVEIDRPWGLMRASHEPGWSVSPGRREARTLTAEEAF